MKDEGGFTLIELLATVVIMGIIGVGITGVVISYLRNTVDTQARMTESQDLQFVTAYWQRDVSSVGVRSDVYDENESVHSFPLKQSVNIPPCAVPSGSTPLITLGWSEYDDLDSDVAPTDVKVTYATRPNGGSRFDLVRIRCVTEPSEFVVADNLTEIPIITCEGGGVADCFDASGAVPSVVRMELRILDPEGDGTSAYIETISGERRQT